jgi:hypothetical protein
MVELGGLGRFWAAWRKEVGREEEKELVCRGEIGSSVMLD